VPNEARPAAISDNAEGGKRLAAHTPVVVGEALELLVPRKAGALMIDGTVGEGGHSEAFLGRFGDLRVIGVDADADIIESARARLSGFGERITLWNGWSHDFFRDCEERPDIVLLDLGVSLFHYERGGRGFSFRQDEALDMRIDTSRGISAAALLAAKNERELADIFYNNGGERYSRRFARAIVETRRHSPLRTSRALAEVIWSAAPAEYRRGGIHPATKCFAALRIAVNGELERLPELLQAAFAKLESGGRIGVISFHSAEDGIVKNFFRDKAHGGEAVLVTKKPRSPGRDETMRNPASRSSKLRVVEKI
jgi:16S rRNA (cytosine1402-N4)-methyltransferase